MRYPSTVAISDAEGEAIASFANLNSMRRLHRGDEDEKDDMGATMVENSTRGTRNAEENGEDEDEPSGAHGWSITDSTVAQGPA